MEVEMSRPPTGYEIRDHTADVALYVWGDTLEGLFRSAAEGFYAVIGELQGAGPTSPTEIILTHGDCTDLLGDFLSELLFVFESSRSRVTDIRFEELRDSRLHATGQLQPLDLQRSRLDCEVKAVTRHNLAIERTDAGFETTIILDL